jgi:hypothetical protein
MSDYQMFELFVQSHLQNVMQSLAIESSQITQRTLSDYQKLLQFEKQVGAVVIQLRRELIRKLAAKVGIEPGVLSAHLEVHTSRRFSYAKLVRLLGVEKVNEFRDRIALTTSKRVIVQESPSQSTMINNGVGLNHRRR